MTWRIEQKNYCRLETTVLVSTSNHPCLAELVNIVTSVSQILTYHRAFLDIWWLTFCAAMHPVVILVSLIDSRTCTTIIFCDLWDSSLKKNSRLADCLFFISACATWSGSEKNTKWKIAFFRKRTKFEVPVTGTIPQIRFSSTINHHFEKWCVRR